MKTEEKPPATGMSDRLKVVFDILTYHHITLSGFRLLRAVIKESGYKTSVVIKSMSVDKKKPSFYGITKENVEDSISIDGIGV